MTDQPEASPTYRFKICRCCSTKVGHLKRVCPRCKVPAIWDKPTPEQQAAYDAKKARTAAFILELMNEPDPS